jgi:ferredoxin
MGFTLPRTSDARCSVGSMGTVRYPLVAAAIEPTGMVARGGFTVTADDVRARADGSPTTSVVIVGNIGGAMWPRFRREERDEPDPLDNWTRRTLEPIAAEFDAELIHPSDLPFPPMLAWAQRAAEVWQSPIGLLIDPRHGLWHAYRGALLFAAEVVELPASTGAVSPCAGCHQPCLSSCPVDAFTPGSYDHESCREHVRSGAQPRCLTEGCAARRACPVNADGHYGADQMEFHMRAFAGA